MICNGRCPRLGGRAWGSPWTERKGQGLVALAFACTRLIYHLVAAAETRPARERGPRHRCGPGNKLTCTTTRRTRCVCFAHTAWTSGPIILLAELFLFLLLSSSAFAPSWLAGFPNVEVPSRLLDLKFTGLVQNSEVDPVS